MVNLVATKLEELGYKVQWQLRPKTFPSITFKFYNEHGGEFADDTEVTTDILCQIDIWTKGDYTDIVKKIKEKMEEIEFFRTNEDDDLEEKEKIYHKILIFTHTKYN